MDALSGFEGILMLALSLYAFLGISILCDEHLCPSLDKLCDHLRIPTALAAATFVSFGSSAPELVISTLGAARNKTELSVPAVLISALIAFAAIPPLVVRAAGPMKLQVREVARDAVAYFLTLLLFVYLNNQESISALNAGMLVAAYLLYLVVVKLTSAPDEFEESADCEAVAEEGAVKKTPETSSTTSTDDEAEEKRKSKEKSHGHHDGHLHMWSRLCCRRKRQDSGVEGPLGSPLIDEAEKGESASESEDDDEPGPVMAALQWPFEAAFDKTISSGAISGFALSMAWLSLLSYLAMLAAEEVVDCWNINPSVAGVTLLAWGGQLPDTIAAVALAKAGKPDEAISQAISSQVINISLGLGLPFLIYSVLTGKPTITQQRATVETVALLVAMSILAYFATMAPGSELLREWMKTSERWSAEITNSRACFLMGSFLVLYISSITLCQIGAENLF
eukprot:TRINITY_DN63855_c0_g1_i1.p1 TRINITY_DN63855_c0_g1~~TRINITY_DN63855_c0_g1_i1.p1  ORF type:complete len:476 (+),score=100.65 TRINITY_DN63855_c0_g1_i1:70-1428(+)